jgi:hypothetical protein
VAVVDKAEGTERRGFLGPKFLFESLAKHRQPLENLESLLPQILVEIRTAELKKQ